MSLSLHIANRFASEKVCSLENAASAANHYSANMKKAGTMVGKFGPNYLRDWREYRAMSQEMLAEQVGTEKPVISLLENGHRKLDIIWLRKLAAVLQCRAGDIIDNSPEDDRRGIRETWSRATPAERAQITGMAEALIQYRGAGE